MAEESAQAYSETTSFPATVDIWLPSGLPQRWPSTSNTTGDRLFQWPISEQALRPEDVTPPILITFMFPLDVTVDLGPPQQFTPLSLELFGVTDVCDQNLNVKFVADDMTEAVKAVGAAQAARG